MDIIYAEKNSYKEHNNGDIQITSGESHTATLAIQKATTPIVTNNGKITDNGEIYGQPFVVNGTGAEFIRIVSNEADFVGANLIAAYTTIETGAALTSVVETSINKNLIIKHQFTITTQSEVIGKDIRVEDSAELTARNGLKVANITIAATKTLTIGNNSIAKVTNLITTEKSGTKYGDLKFSMVPAERPTVLATDIETNGANWTSYPVYGQTVE